MTEELHKGLVRVLNVHGYAFQYSVLKAAENLYETNRSPWLFEAAEFPVSLKDISERVRSGRRIGGGGGGDGGGTGGG